MECDWQFLPEVIEAPLDISRSVELFHRVNLQVFEACEQTQPDMSSRAYYDGALVPSEHHIAEFHKWWAEQISTQIGPSATRR